MKELTHEEWINSVTPRTMWVWDDDETCRVKMKVIYVSKQYLTYPVVALSDNDIDLCRYKHCAEIEQPRRMTHKELSRWLREKPTREWKYKDGISVYGYYGYEEKRVNEEVLNNIFIREDDGDWKEPLVEV